MDVSHKREKAVKELEKALLSLDRIAVKRVLSMDENQESLIQRVEELIVPALENIGRGWEEGSISLSQVYMSGRICEEIIDNLTPAIKNTRIKQPKTAIVVLEDFHMLGKRLVYSFLRANGYDIKDFNRMKVDEIADRVKSEKIEVLMISALMLPSAQKVKDLKLALHKVSSKVKLVVGGAPFRSNPVLWQEVDADAFGYSASDAVKILHQLST